MVQTLTERRKEEGLSAFEAEVVALFVDTVRGFGAPKSVGAIYGLLFASKKPVSFEHIVGRLKMSTGSVSQGLKLLRSIGAVKTAFVPGERRDFFVVETQFRKLAASFLQNQLDRRLTDGEGRLSEILNGSFKQDATVAESKLLQQRLGILLRWQERAREVVPMILCMLEESA